MEHKWDKLTRPNHASFTRPRLGLLALGDTLSLTDESGLSVHHGSMTAMSILGAGSTLTFGVNASQTAALAANCTDVDEIVVKPGSVLVLGNPSALSGSFGGATDSAAAGGAVSIQADVQAGSAAAPASVPEPCTLALLFLGGLCLLPCLRQRLRR